MPKYHVTFAHADVRETAGQLTDDTPKGWGNVEIETDHTIDNQADRDEVARAIGTRELREDGSPKYTHIAVNDIRLLDADGELVVNEKALRSSDFITDAEEHVLGVMAGLDEYFVLWGHVMSDNEVLEAMARYFDYTDAWDEVVTRDVFLASKNSLDIKRVYGLRLSDPDEELIVGWHETEEPDTYPITVVQVRQSY